MMSITLPASRRLTMAFFFLIAIINGCNSGEHHAEDDRLLAEVYDKQLYLSDMDGMLPEGMSKEDSSLIINKFVRVWVKEAAMLHEAEKNVPAGLDIDQLVEDYRASLIKHNYENVLVNKLLDSTITSAELEAFYEKNKEQYQLETPILRCRFIKAPRDAPQLDQVQEWWKSDDPADKLALQNWSAANAVVHYLQDSTWYKVVDITAYMPQGMLTVDNISGKRDFVQRDEEFVYLFKALEVVDRKDIAPLAYIEDQARRVILHKRKMELLEEMKNKLYDEAMRKKSVAVYE